MHGTTVSTNAVVERKGPKLACFVTKGYRDLVELQRTGVRNPLNLFETRTRLLGDRAMVFEVDERLLRGWIERTPVDEAAVEELAKRAAGAGAGTGTGTGTAGFAVVLPHSYANPNHERAVARAILTAFGEDADISLSSEI